MNGTRVFRHLPPIALGVILASMFSAASARADSYTFFSMTNNRSGDAAVGEAQLRMEVEAVGTGQVRFTFTNLGPGPSSITDVILG